MHAYQMFSSFIIEYIHLNVDLLFVLAFWGCCPWCGNLVTGWPCFSPIPGGDCHRHKWPILKVCSILPHCGRILCLLGWLLWMLWSTEREQMHAGSGEYKIKSSSNLETWQCCSSFVEPLLCSLSAWNSLTGWVCFIKIWWPSRWKFPLRLCSVNLDYLLHCILPYKIVPEKLPRKFAVTLAHKCCISIDFYSPEQL